jgi:hypothetical protein
MPTPLPAFCASTFISALASSSSLRISVDRSDVTSLISSPTDACETSRVTVASCVVSCDMLTAPRSLGYGSAI